MQGARKINHACTPKPWKPIVIHFGPSLLIWQTVEAMDVLGRWCSTPSMLLLPPGSSMSLIHQHTITIITHPHRQTHTAPPSICSETRSSKTSEVGANPESRDSPNILHPPTLSLPLSYSNRWWGGLWVSTASCIHLLDKRVSQPSVPDAFALVLPTFTTREMIPSKGRSKGVDRWHIVYAFHCVQFHCNCTTCDNFLSDIDSCFFFLMASLQGAMLYLMCVFFKKRWLHLCIVGAFVRFSWLDLSVCRHF